MPGGYEKSTEAVLKINMATALESLLENVNSSGQSMNSLSKAVSDRVRLFGPKDTCFTERVRGKRG